MSTEFISHELFFQKLEILKNRKIPFIFPIMENGKNPTGKIKLLNSAVQSFFLQYVWLSVKIGGLKQTFDFFLFFPWKKIPI